MVVEAVAADAAGCTSSCTNTFRSEAASRRLRRQRLRAFHADNSQVCLRGDHFADKRDDAVIDNFVTPPRKPPGFFKDYTPEKIPFPDLLPVADAGEQVPSWHTVHTSLDALTASLCDKLYRSDGDISMTMESPGYTEDDIANMTPSDNLAQTAEDLLHTWTELEELMALKVYIDASISHLDQAAALAISADARCAGTGDDAEAHFMDLYYRRLDPVGMQESIEEETDMKHQEQELRVNLCGHLFTFSRHRFWEIIGNCPTELRSRFVQYGISRPQVKHEMSDMSQSVYEDLFFDHNSQAYEWQEWHNDESDDDDLMTLLQLLREPAVLETFFV